MSRGGKRPGASRPRGRPAFLAGVVRRQSVTLDKAGAAALRALSERWAPPGRPPLAASEVIRRALLLSLGFVEAESMQVGYEPREGVEGVGCLGSAANAR